MIFLDNASTTCVFDEVLSTMSDINSAFFYNPSALYKNALDVKNILEESRRTVAKKIGAQKNELFFTSCATESNNWILNNGFKNKKGSLVISAGEHASVYDCAVHQKSKGLDVRIVLLKKDGSLDLYDLEKKLDKDTSLVSLIHVSNETGAVNDMESIAKIIRKKSPEALIHSDGVQAFCKIKTDVKKMDVDFYTISAHKIGGPKGCGAAYINSRIKIAPLLHGGGQEGGMRSGTENIPGIAGFARAACVFEEKYDKAKTDAVFGYLKSRLSGGDGLLNHNNLTAGLSSGTSDGQSNNSSNSSNSSNLNSSSNSFDSTVLNGYNKNNKNDGRGEGFGRGGGFIYNGSPHNSGFILSLSYSGLKSEVLQHILSDEGVLIGLGSACSSKSNENRVLSAMGRDKREIEGNIRLSFSPDTTLEEAVVAAEKIEQAVLTLKKKAGI